MLNKGDDELEEVELKTMQSKRVALCVTCLVDQVVPEVGVATVQLLRRAGYDVDFPEAQTCCGQPFFNSGFRDQAVDLAKRTIEIFEPFDAVVLPSGSCASMIRVEYPHLLEESHEWHRRAAELAEKTYELSEFLVNYAGWSPEGDFEEVKLTYHDSCHMCRLLGVSDEPRQMLERVGGRISEMSESDRCCGFGGLFSVRMPEVSNAMTGEKLRQACDVGVETLVTSDPGCLTQMRGLADGSSIKVEHIATVLEEMTR
ncbi:MAG: (Fe-S)-binding protein [Candidatus Poribacteria bacterium]|nr:(Fe-S)-binding protein [Candidatus Poribacteria bacterium]